MLSGIFMYNYFQVSLPCENNSILNEGISVQNRFFNFREYAGQPKYLSIVFFVLGVSAAAFALIGIVFYLRYTPPKNVLIEIPILLISLSAFFVNIILLFCTGNSSADSRRQNILVTILVWTAIIYFFNGVLPRINWRKMEWQAAQVIPNEAMAGMDFESGLYNPAKAILEGEGSHFTNYPPVVTLLAMPLTYFTLWRAYIIFLTLLYITNIAAVVVANLLAGEISEKGQGLSWEIAGMVTMYTLTSYGLFFGLKNGNYDVFPSFFAVLGIFFLVRFPEKIWLSTLFLSLATHLKVYPGILFLLLIWRYGLKSIVPLFIINIGLFLSLGFDRMVEFFAQLGPYVSNPFITVKNSSAISFAEHLILNGVSLDKSLLTGIFIAIPVLIWLGSAFFIYRKGFDNLGVLWYFVVSFGPMFALPAVSHDYKLVILSAPLVLALFRMAETYARTGSALAAIIIILFMVTAIFIHRSVFDSTILYFQNKYCSVLAFQILGAWGMYTDFSSQKQILSENIPRRQSI
ncbi:hypothetical protein ANRL3_02885 [Anaerolineae bacterium]|nr:hypothetical protein ANRL3_02885 [Anaerolineae bacterium]